MTEPATFADLVARLNDDLREYFEERAAIREFDGGLPRDHAEAMALLDTLRRDPLAFTGVTALQVEIGGVRRVVLTTDVPWLTLTSKRSAPRSSALLILHNVIRKFNGIAELTRFR